MASSGVNALRWGALVFGVFYGFTHQSAIWSQDRRAHAQHEWDRKTKLIDDARAAYEEKKNPKAISGDGVITNPDDPQFDLEKYLTKVSKESA